MVVLANEARALRTDDYSYDVRAKRVPDMVFDASLVPLSNKPKLTDEIQSIFP